MPSVLSTKCLTESQKNLILQSGWALAHYNAIQTKRIANLDYLKNAYFENAIITSQKTVFIVKELNIQMQNVFCVGEKTANSILEFNSNILEIAAYSEDLANVILSKYAHLQFDFFCGKSRNDVLPNKLSQNEVEFKEHHLYETKSNPKKFNSPFDAILFYSPSGVKSYFATNTYQGERLICIGKTTASTAKVFSKKVEIASKTSIESLIVKLVKS
jgi:uroporphyrinogen-III synthase